MRDFTVHRLIRIIRSSQSKAEVRSLASSVLQMEKLSPRKVKYLLPQAGKEKADHLWCSRPAAAGGGGWGWGSCGRLPLGRLLLSGACRPGLVLCVHLHKVFKGDSASCPQWFPPGSGIWRSPTGTLSFFLCTHSVTEPFLQLAFTIFLQLKKKIPETKIKR